MSLLRGKMHLFGISNVIVSFAFTSFMGINYCYTCEQDSLTNGELAMVEEDLEPASQWGDNKEEKVVKESTTKKTVTNVVKKKEVAATVKYTPASYSEVTGNAVVEYAKKYLKLKYVSGGNSLSTGTDCSGFTKLIYKEFGVSLPRTVKGQTGSGTYVRKSDLQKGDLVFYGTGSGKATHVAIYIGNNQVIHESNRRDGVKISSVNMMQYITARRVINSNSLKIVEEKLKEEKSETDNQTVLEADNKAVEEVKEENNVSNDSFVYDENSLEDRNENIVENNLVE